MYSFTNDRADSIFSELFQVGTLLIEPTKTILEPDEIDTLIPVIDISLSLGFCSHYYNHFPKKPLTHCQLTIAIEYYQKDPPFDYYQ